jgi:hypothetical protein
MAIGRITIVKIAVGAAIAGVPGKSKSNSENEKNISEKGILPPIQARHTFNPMAITHCDDPSKKSTPEDPIINTVTTKDVDNACPTAEKAKRKTPSNSLLEALQSTGKEIPKPLQKPASALIPALGATTLH